MSAAHPCQGISAGIGVGPLARSLLALGWLALGVAARTPGEVHHVQASFPVDGRLLDGRFVDLDGDGLRELVLAMRLPDAQRRELRVHRWTAEGLLDSRPSQVVPVLDDVVAWSVADVRDEPGREFVFLTRNGAWSLSPTREGYRNNIERLADTPLFYDVPDPYSMPYWSYVVERAGGDALLLPGPTGCAIWARRPATGSPASADGAEAGSHAPEGGTISFGEDADEDDGRSRRGSLQAGAGGVRLSFGNSRADAFADPLAHLATEPLLSSDRRVRSPALLDLDGNGHLELISQHGPKLQRQATGPFAPDADPSAWQPREERLPESLAEAGGSLDLLFHDLDGDGDLDTLLVAREERSGALKMQRDYRLFVLIHDGASLFPAEPRAVLVFEAADLRCSVTDVDGDGLPDLVLSKVTAPDLFDLTDPEHLTFARSTLVFLGLGGGDFERRPSLAHELVFDEESLAQAVTRQLLSHDCSGDGVADLVDVDLKGRIAIYRVRHESGLFSDSWEIDREPWKHFDSEASLQNLQVDDLNGDGIGDIFSLEAGGVTLLLSRTGSGR